MAINIDQVYRILENKGTVKFNRNNIMNATTPKGMNDDRIVTYNYRMAKTTIGLTDITMNGTKDEASADAVYVEYEDAFATVGAIDPPGIIYSDSFAGCIFYVYRGGVDTVYGVHASKTTQLEANPTDYFKRRGAQLLYKWESRGRIPPGLFGSVLICVNEDILEIFGLAMRGNKVENILSRRQIADWRRYSG